MTRTTMFVIVLATISVLILAGVSKVLDAGKIKELKAEGDALRLDVAATNVRLESYVTDSTNFAAARDSFDNIAAELRADLRSERRNRRAVIASRDSARATVEIDTLTPQLRNMIVLEREAALSFQQERDLERQLRMATDSQLTRFRDRMRAAESLLFTLRAERDTALSLVARHEARLTFNLWRFLGDQIPQLLACAGGGAIVATLYEGNELIGAGVGLAACLVKSAVF